MTYSVFGGTLNLALSIYLRNVRGQNVYAECPTSIYSLANFRKQIFVHCK